ncbi:hypothetical protein BJ742DRAFT_398539 [Cladochytrium replicatum]|nr:hypothetical protein BJ742DRAFT_398539 [Cladochytrium replicatum]
MLKRHQACIDLKNNLLRIGDEVIPFLPEHELPERARLTRLSSESPVTLSAPPAPAASSSSSAPAARPAGPLATTSSKYPESSIKTLMDLGASREEAIGALDACGGNTELAANMLFAQ